MEAQLFEILKQFGVTGGSLYIAYLMAKSRFDDFKDRLAKMEAKIDECEKDRVKLWRRIAGEPAEK